MLTLSQEVLAKLRRRFSWRRVKNWGHPIILFTWRWEKRLLVLLVCFLLSSLPGMLRAEEVEGGRTEKGYVIKKGSYVSLPEGARMKRIAGNVIAPEPIDEYAARQFDLLKRRLTASQQATERQLRELEARLTERLDQIEKKLTS